MMIRVAYTVMNANNNTTLKGMSASRFIGPFFNTVQMWEKSLSHISEVLEVTVDSFTEEY